MNVLADEPIPIQQPSRRYKTFSAGSIRSNDFMKEIPEETRGGGLGARGERSAGARVGVEMPGGLNENAGDETNEPRGSSKSSDTSEIEMRTRSR